MKSSFQNLRHHTLIHVSTRMDEWRAWLHSAGIDEIGFGKDLRFSSSSLATGAAVEGLGIALADRHLVYKELRSGQLVVPFDIALDTQSAFYLVWPKNRPMSYSMKAFKEWVLEEVEAGDEGLDPVGVTGSP